MTSNDWLASATQQLSTAGITSARLDSLVLLEAAIGRDRSWLLAHPEHELTTQQQTILANQLQRRRTHEPLAYIRGHVEFYGRDFMVDNNVLVPRPETETMIELLKKYALPGAVVADIGTGSGALAITAVLETAAVAIAVDIDEACLAVAKRNAVQQRAPITLLQGNLLEPILALAPAQQPSVLLCNLPYVPNEYTINDAAKQEPALALYGGKDGLDLYRELFKQVAQLTIQPQLILTEALELQHNALTNLAQQHGWHMVEHTLLTQVFVPLSSIN